MRPFDGERSKDETGMRAGASGRCRRTTSVDDAIESPPLRLGPVGTIAGWSRPATETHTRP